VPIARSTRAAEFPVVRIRRTVFRAFPRSSRYGWELVLSLKASRLRAVEFDSAALFYQGIAVHKSGAFSRISYTAPSCTWTPSAMSPCSTRGCTATMRLLSHSLAGKGYVQRHER
jgi:hypothetical protein